MKRFTQFLLFASLFAACIAPPVLAAGRSATAAEKQQADQVLLALQANPAQQQQIMQHQLLYGAPVPTQSVPGEHCLVQPDYVLWYSDQLRVPLWAGYLLRREDVPRGPGVDADRINAFRPDPRLTPQQRADLADYRGSGFDRGHAAPNADFKRAVTSIVNTFILSNMCPQQHDFNAHAWGWFEDMVRGWATTKGYVYIITGSVFDTDNNGARDPITAIKRIPPRGRVALPTAFYKIVVHPEGGRMSALAVVLPADFSPTHAQLSAYLLQHVKSLSTLETLTGTRFFPQLTPQQKSDLEQSGAVGVLAQRALPALLWTLWG